MQTLEGEGMGNSDSTFCTLGKNVDNWNQPLTTLTTDKKRQQTKLLPRLLRISDGALFSNGVRNALTASIVNSYLGLLLIF